MVVKQWGSIMSSIRELCPKCGKERQVSGLYFHESVKNKKGKAVVKYARIPDAFRCTECGVVVIDGVVVRSMSSD